ncbi:MAG: hypothetical protein V2A73_05530 [Pseudomonadota bacterium]
MTDKTKLTPKQALVLWNLLFTGEQPALSKIKPDFSGAECQPLVQAGLVELERRGRANHLVLTDKAWDQAASYLDSDIMQSKYAVPVLGALLAKLKTYVEQYGVPLSELLCAVTPSATPPIDPSGDRPGSEGSPALSQHIRAAYLQASGGQLNERVRLSELRRLLAEDDRSRVDAALLQLQQEGDLFLYRLDNPAERGAEDDEAAVDVAGEKRHVIYVAR